MFGSLQVEYNFWMDWGTRAVDVEDRNGVHHILNRYYSDSKLPRPESYVADELTAWMLWQQKTEGVQEPFTAEKKREKLEKHNIQRLYERQEADLIYAAHEEQVPGGNRKSIPLPPHPIHDNETIIHELYAQLASAAETG